MSGTAEDRPAATDGRRTRRRPQSSYRVALGRRIRDLRKAAHLTQRELAIMMNEYDEAFGWSYTTVAEIQRPNGTRTATVDEAVALADIFGITVDELLRQTPPPPDPDPLPHGFSGMHHDPGTQMVWFRPTEWQAEALARVLDRYGYRSRAGLLRDALEPGLRALDEAKAGDGSKQA